MKEICTAVWIFHISMYGAFRASRMINPLDWDSKMDYWKKQILQYACNDKCLAPTIELAGLKEVFTQNGNVPMCLDTVFEDMIANKQCVPFTEFIDTRTALWRHPLLRMGRAISRVAQSKFRGVETTYVLTEAADKLTAMWIEHGKRQVNVTDRIMTVGALADALLPGTPSDRDRVCDLLVGLAAAVPWADVFRGDWGVAIVFTGRGIKGTTPHDPVTEGLVRGTILLRREVDSINARLADTKRREAEATEEVRAELRANRRKSALAVLRRAKMYQTAIDQLQGQAFNCNAILMKMSSASSNVGMVDAMKAGVTAMRAAMAGHSIEEAEDVAGDVSVLCEEIEAVSAVLAEGGTPDAEQDAAMDAELDAMEAAAAQETLEPAGLDPSVVQPDVLGQVEFDEVERKMMALGL